MGWLWGWQEAVGATEGGWQEQGPQHPPCPPTPGPLTLSALCPQRQVRHPFVHGLGDSWQGQRHLFISE